MLSQPPLKEFIVAKTLAISSQALREQLMSPLAIDRIHAMHALECEIDHADQQVSRELRAFTARGIPYYAPHDAAYQRWVNKAVSCLDKLISD